MVSQVYTKNKVSGEVFIREEHSRLYDSESVTIDNTAEGLNLGEDLTLQPGHPMMEDGTPVAAADIANAEGVLLMPAVIKDGETVLATIITKGDSVVLNRTLLPTTDHEDAAINMTNYATRLEALGFVLRSESEDREEQTS